MQIPAVGLVDHCPEGNVGEAVKELGCRNQCTDDARSQFILIKATVRQYLRSAAVGAHTVLLIVKT